MAMAVTDSQEENGRSGYQKRSSHFVETDPVDTVESDFYKEFISFLRISQANKIKEEETNENVSGSPDDYSLLSRFCNSMNTSKSILGSAFYNPFMIMGFVPLPPALTSGDMAWEVSKDNSIDYHLAKEHFDRIQGIDLITPLERNLCGHSDALMILRMNKNMTQEEAEKAYRELGFKIGNRLGKWENGAVPWARKSIDPFFLIYAPSDDQGAEQEPYNETCLHIRKNILEKSGFCFEESSKIRFHDVIRNLTCLSPYNKNTLKQAKVIRWVYDDQKPEDKKALLDFIAECFPEEGQYGNLDFQPLYDLDPYQLQDLVYFEEQKQNALQIYGHERREELGYCYASEEDITVGDGIRNLWILSGKPQLELLGAISKGQSTFANWMSNEDNPENTEIVQAYIQACRPPAEDAPEEHKLYEEQKDILLRKYVDNDRKIRYKDDDKTPNVRDLIRNMFLLSGYTNTTIDNLAKKCGLKSSQIEYWLYGSEDSKGRTGLPEFRADLAKFIKGCEPSDTETKKKELYEPLKTRLMKEYNAEKRKEKGYCEKDDKDIQLHEALINVAILSDMTDVEISKKSGVPKGTLTKWYNRNLPHTEKKLTGFCKACKPIDMLDETTLVLYEKNRVNARNKYRERGLEIRKQNIKNKKKTGYCEKTAEEIEVHEVMKNMFILSGRTMGEVTEITERAGSKITKSSMDRWFATGFTSTKDKLSTFIGACKPIDASDIDALSLYKQNKVVALGAYHRKSKGGETQDMHLDM
jgi:transcriptional regulator with XRE-family HTH domain